ncbi:enoyl-CoA hydratase/isomerase family protein [Desulfoluna sp.]|uniref:enoyl-CoA hydratase/isomerase family protein n=1 Tax=Desulfoluna sp. TaxID=2045199 RepID=UPI002607EF78|nr:enoyl-CoA hydratase/isomerase family protein [Desulfoluna sp.]
MTQSLDNNDTDLFTSERVEDVEVLTFHKHLLHHLTDLPAKTRILEYLDSVSKDPTIRVFLILAAPQRLDKEAYLDFYRQYLSTSTVADQTLLKRLYNGLNQFIMKLYTINPFVVHAGSGNTAFLFMNLSLACDYRITSEETLFENPVMDLGLPPKGGGVFFLSHMLGPAKCAEILYSGRDINMDEALSLGLVNRVVKPESLRTSALEIAHAFAHKSPQALFGIKKLLGYGMKDLEGFLEYENKILETTLRRHQHEEM